ncbi:MAG: hypothetical protein ACLFU8_10550 [Anaerolineales bacterium]
MTQLRIRGLVRAARWAREQLAMGILPEEVASFRREVRHLLRDVEGICEVHDTQPEALPSPSYRAYRFLKDLDLDDLPLREGDAPVVPQTVHVTYVVAAQNDLNALFAAWAAQHPTGAVRMDDPEVQEFLELLEGHTSEIEALAAEQGGSPGLLPTRSRRAYQWLKFLSEPQVLITHLETLRDLLQEFQKPHCRELPAKKERPKEVQIDFHYTSNLYRVYERGQLLRVGLHEGLIGAPPAILRDLVCAILSRKGGGYGKSAREYTGSEDFLEVVTALEMTTAETEDVTQGRHFDLAEVFERVNAAYFDGRLDRPRLTWNRSFTHSKMGHYDFLRDTLLISVSLDDPKVPDYVIDFVVYHELLHKAFGVDVVGGRRYAHTPEFRKAEASFEHYDEARAFLLALHRT